MSILSGLEHDYVSLLDLSWNVEPLAQDR